MLVVLICELGAWKWGDWMKNPSLDGKTMSVKSVLVTGFEPFGGHTKNVSAEVARQLSDLTEVVHPWTGTSVPVSVTMDVLSVDRSGACKTAARIRNGETYDAILHLGLCERCEHPQIERLARDRLDMRIPDNLGRQVRETALDGEGDRGIWVDPSRWPANAFNVPFHLSTDAGAYLCNETFFETLKSLEESTQKPLPPPCVFVHLPDTHRLPVEASTAFSEHVLAFLLHPTPDAPVHVVAGYLSDGTGKHLIAKRSPGEFDAGSWEFPGGKIEEGESWAASVERELREELRLDVTGRQLLGTVVRDVGTTTYAVHLVRCDWSGALDRLGLDVHDAVAWVDLTDSDRPWAGRDAEFHSLIGDLTHNQVEASPSSVIARSSLMERGT